MWEGPTPIGVFLNPFGFLFYIYCLWPFIVHVAWLVLPVQSRAFICNQIVSMEGQTGKGPCLGVGSPEFSRPVWGFPFCGPFLSLTPFGAFSSHYFSLTTIWLLFHTLNYLTKVSRTKNLECLPHMPREEFSLVVRLADQGVKFDILGRVFWVHGWELVEI